MMLRSLLFVLLRNESRVLYYSFCKFFLEIKRVKCLRYSAIETPAVFCVKYRIKFTTQMSGINKVYVKF